MPPFTAGRWCCFPFLVPSVVPRPPAVLGPALVAAPESPARCLDGPAAGFETRVSCPIRHRGHRRGPSLHVVADEIRAQRFHPPPGAHNRIPARSVAETAGVGNRRKSSMFPGKASLPAPVVGCSRALRRNPSWPALQSLPVSVGPPRPCFLADPVSSVGTDPCWRLSPLGSRAPPPRGCMGGAALGQSVPGRPLLQSFLPPGKRASGRPPSELDRRQIPRASAPAILTLLMSSAAGIEFKHQLVPHLACPAGGASPPPGLLFAARLGRGGSRFPVAARARAPQGPGSRAWPVRAARRWGRSPPASGLSCAPFAARGSCWRRGPDLHVPSRSPQRRPLLSCLGLFSLGAHAAGESGIVPEARRAPLAGHVAGQSRLAAGGGFRTGWRSPGRRSGHQEWPSVWFVPP